MKLQNLEELRAMAFPPLRPFIGNGILMENSKAVLFGAPKLHKSILAQQMGFCIAAGISFLGFPSRGIPARVAYIQGEESKRMFRDRLDKMATFVPVPLNMFWTTTEFSLRLDTLQGQRDLEAVLKAVRPQVLILDPLYKLLSSTDDKTVARFFDAMDYYIVTYNLTILIVAHDRKPITTDKGMVLNMGGADLRGPRLLEAWFESIIRVDGNPNDDIRWLSFELRHATQTVHPVKCMFDRQRLWFF